MVMYLGYITFFKFKIVIVIFFACIQSHLMIVHKITLLSEN